MNHVDKAVRKICAKRRRVPRDPVADSEAPSRADIGAEWTHHRQAYDH